MASKSYNSSNNSSILGALAILMALLGILLTLGIFHSAGSGGNLIWGGLATSVGFAAYVLPVACFASSYYLWVEKWPRLKFKIVFAGIATLLLVLALSYIVLGSGVSGALGAIVAIPIIEMFGSALSGIMITGLVLAILMLVTGRKPRISNIKERVPSVLALNKITEVNDEVSEEESSKPSLISRITNIFSFAKSDTTEEIEDMTEEEVEPVVKKKKSAREELFEGFEEKDEEAEDEVNPEDEEEVYEEVEEEEEAPVKTKILLAPPFVPPPLALLNADSGKSGGGDTGSKMKTIKHTLDQFRIPVEMGEVTVGPSVTQFTLKPAQGVKVSRILALKDNLQMALSADNVHIQAPIPGKPFVGIEVPNEKKQMLGLRSMLELEPFQKGNSMTIAIGKNIVGKPVFGDLIEMPHLLIAGATKSGKSVTLQNVLLSLLYKNSPYDLKLIIIDPKRVEFTAYKGLPHLYTPIITDPKGAIKALNWAIQEMERRYEILAEAGLPNLKEYNKKIYGPAVDKALRKGKEADSSDLPPKLSWIVLVFDEFNDFILSHSKEITPLITSLAQKGRAAGIHLILATQRPSTNVITGSIKANIIARIALKTSSNTDSRVILDESGAEDLLGNGDMLYMDPGNPNLTRIQAPYVSTEEINAVIKHVKQANFEMVPEQIDLQKVNVAATSGSGSGSSGGGSQNPLEAGEEPLDNDDYVSAKDYVIATGKASSSALQTAFGWGFPKSNKIVFLLERHGVVGPANGAKPREVLIGRPSNNDAEE